MNLLLHDSGLISSGSGGGGILPLERRDLDIVSGNMITKLRCVTAFTMWQLATNGEWGQIQEFVGYFRAKGFTDFRVFGCWGNTLWNPLNHNNSYDALDQLESYLNNNESRLFLDLFTDQVPNSPVLMTPSNQSWHATSTLQVLRKRRTSRAQWVNEYRKNWMPPYPIQFPSSIFQGVVACWSTWYDGADPQEMGPNLSFVNKHTGGFDEEWSRKSKVCVEAQRGQGGGLGSYPPANRACIVGEKVRIAEGALPREYADSTAIEEGMGNGGCLHGGFGPSRGHDSDLQHCVIPTKPEAVACIDAASMVFDVIPPNLSAIGEYRNAGGGIVLHDDNLMLRTYAMVVGNSAWVFRVKGHKPGMPLTPINGWEVVDKLGYDENVVNLER